MGTSYSKPRMTRDGLTAVSQCFNTFPFGPAARIRAEEKLEQIFSLIGQYELTPFSHIHKWEQAEFWEFMYLERNQLSPTQLFHRWGVFKDLREKSSGGWRITGNFVELSHAWQVDTRDPALVARFEAVFAAQPASFHTARIDWEKRCEESWAPRKRRWENVNPEDYFRELQAKAS